MKLEINTTVKALELANMILAQGIDELKRPGIAEAWRVSKAEIEACEKLRGKIVETLLK